MEFGAEDPRLLPRAVLTGATTYGAATGIRVITELPQEVLC